jgi:hypothetical protein
MANVKVSELSELTSAADNDVVPIVDTSADETKKITVENLLQNAGSSSDTEPIYLFGAGQSNLVGFHSNDYSATLINGENPSNLVEIWNRYNTAWEVWDLNSSTAQYGDALATDPVTQLPGVPGRNCPMFHLAQKVAFETGRKVRVLMSERGGTDIDKWLTTANGGTNTIWSEFASDVTNSQIPRFDGCVWMHGENHENDIRNSTYSPYSPGAVTYLDDVRAFWTQVLNHTNTAGDPLMDQTTPVAVGMIRDFWQNSGVRQGGPTGVNGLYATLIDPVRAQMAQESVKFIVAPHKDLESDENIGPAVSPDGGNHYGRRQLVEMGQRYWYSAIFQPGNPIFRKRIINEDTTYTISTTGYYTDRINGKFDSWDNFSEFFRSVELVNNPVITVEIEDGTYNQDIIIPDHPNFDENFTLKGINQGSTPSFNGVFADDLAALETFLPTKFTGSLTVNKNVNIQNILFHGTGSGSGINVNNYSDKIRWLGVINYNIGVTDTAAYFKPVSNFYSMHNASYGIRVNTGDTVLSSGTISFLYNGTYDYFAALLGRIFSGNKAGATFNPTRGSGPNSTGAAIY